MQIKFFKKVKPKTNKILFEGFKEKTFKPIIEEDKLEQKVIVKEKIKKPKKPDNIIKKEKINYNEIDVTVTIAIASLDDNCGCTHITQSFASYIKNHINSAACVVDFCGKYTKSNIDLYNKVDICNLYGKYKYIIINIGNLKERDTSDMDEFKRANIKLFITRLENTYMKQIAEYLRQDILADKWIYLFNFVSKDQFKKVDDLMEDYIHYCLPLHNKENPDEETCKIYNEILRTRGRKR